MTTAFLLLTLTCPVGNNMLPMMAVSAPLTCGGWGDRSATSRYRANQPTTLVKFLGLFHRNSGSHEGLPGVGVPPAAVYQPAPTSLPTASYQPPPASANLPSAQGQRFPDWGN